VGGGGGGGGRRSLRCLKNGENNALRGADSHNFPITSPRKP